jgi:hypothetical protein
VKVQKKGQESSEEASFSDLESSDTASGGGEQGKPQYGAMKGGQQPTIRQAQSEKKLSPVFYPLGVISRLAVSLASM